MGHSGYFHFVVLNIIPKKKWIDAWIDGYTDRGATGQV